MKKEYIQISLFYGSLSVEIISMIKAMLVLWGKHYAGMLCDRLQVAVVFFNFIFNYLLDLVLKVVVFSGLIVPK